MGSDLSVMLAGRHGTDVESNLRPNRDEGASGAACGSGLGELEDHDHQNNDHQNTNDRSDQTSVHDVLLKELVPTGTETTTCSCTSPLHCTVRAASAHPTHSAMAPQHSRSRSALVRLSPHILCLHTPKGGLRTSAPATCRRSAAGCAAPHAGFEQSTGRGPRSPCTGLRRD